MSEKADVIIIGAGISGVSAAWHLQEEGVRDVVVLERDEVASGTTAAGAGFIGLWAHAYLPGWGDEELELESYGLDFYRSLAERHDIDYRNNGTLWLATSAEAYADHVHHIFTGGRDPDRREVEPGEAAALSGGLIQADGLHRTVLFPSGGQVSAAGAAKAVAAEVVARGGRIETRRSVEGIRIRGGRAVGVDTAHGPIDADAVVLAAGAWSNRLLAPLDVWAPHVPLTLTRLITEPQDVSSTAPGMFMPECHGLWVREHRGGILWGCAYRNRVRYMFADGDVPDRFDAIPYDGVFEIFRAGREAAAVLPALSREVSLTVAQGIPCYTADSRGLTGLVPGVDGLYLVGGDNESGVGHGPGYGRIVAQAVASGQDGSVEAFRVDRFDASVATGQDVMRAMEDHATTYFV